MSALRCFICGTKREDRADFGFVYRNGVRVPLCHPGDWMGTTCYSAWSGYLTTLGAAPSEYLEES